MEVPVTSSSMAIHCMAPGHLIHQSSSTQKWLCKKVEWNRWKGDLVTGLVAHDTSSPGAHLSAGSNTWQGLHSVHTHCAAPQQRQGPFEKANEEHLIKDQTLMHKQKDGESERCLALSKGHGQGLLWPPRFPYSIAFHTEHALARLDDLSATGKDAFLYNGALCGEEGGGETVLAGC